MPNINLRGVVNNISQRTNIYSPLVEGIVNSIDSIGRSGTKNGIVKVRFARDSQIDMKFDGDSLGDIVSIEIEDNGQGFTDENTKSFDTLYSDLKQKEGGKGFGRFTFLKYFENVKVESNYKSQGKYFYRTFEFNTKNQNQIVAKQKVIESTNEQNKTVIFLNSITQKNFDKRIETIARKLLEKLLIFFINEKYACPQIIFECDGKTIILNDLLKDYPEIQLVGDSNFVLKNKDSDEQFRIKVFKIFYPDNQKSKISLVAHNREVIEAPIHNYIPEFIENFFEVTADGTNRDYFIKSYVLANFLDTNVSLERNEFKFPKTYPDLQFDITQNDIERRVALLTKNLDMFSDEIQTRQQKKSKRIMEYINSEAPWYKSYLKDIDLPNIPYNLDDETIETELNRVKFFQERQVKGDVKKILEDQHQTKSDKVDEIMSRISEANMSELAHYVAFRKNVLDIFKKSLEFKSEGTYFSEDTVHSIIFPTKKDSDSIQYDNHNLWIIDEKLNFTEYISSDKPHNTENKDRADILIFNRKVAFRAENEPSNPITIFEFKKPQRDDFVNPGSSEDPVEQIIRYVISIKEGKCKTPEGRDIHIGSNTPFFGYIVCDLTPKVKKWLLEVQNFKEMPDGLGWYGWKDNINLYLEVLSWEKLLKDAEMRNKIFFKKLGIE